MTNLAPVLHWRYFFAGWKRSLIQAVRMRSLRAHCLRRAHDLLARGDPSRKCVVFCCVRRIFLRLQKALSAHPR